METVTDALGREIATIDGDEYEVVYYEMEEASCDECAFQFDVDRCLENPCEDEGREWIFKRVS